jgi:hypothetical protein
MSANREVYGWPELGNSDAHTLHAIGSGCTWFEGSTAQDVRAAIETGRSAPGGRLWRVEDYLRLAGHRIQKRRALHRQRVA